MFLFRRRAFYIPAGKTAVIWAWRGRAAAEGFVRVRAGEGCVKFRAATIERLRGAFGTVRNFNDIEMEEFLTVHFWQAVGQIVMIDILLGGDNAVVIAMACRRLSPEQRVKGVLWGTAGAIILRVILIAFALVLLDVKFLKVVGGLLLLWIGVKLLLPPSHDDEHQIAAGDNLWTAVRTIIVADFVMSLDNVLAISGAAKNAGEQHELLLACFGLLVSIPIIIWGSRLVLKLMDRFPIIIVLGGMLLGWIAGGMVWSDAALAAHLPDWKWGHHTAAAIGALLVLIIGRLLGGKKPNAALKTHPVAAKPPQEADVSQ